MSFKALSVFLILASAPSYYYLAGPTYMVTGLFVLSVAAYLLFWREKKVDEVNESEWQGNADVYSNQGDWTWEVVFVRSDGNELIYRSGTEKDPNVASRVCQRCGDYAKRNKTSENLGITLRVYREAKPLARNPEISH